MKEHGWLEADDPSLMLDTVNQKGASDRKLRLFTIGCCRRLWEYLDDEKGRPALEAAEQGADGGLYGHALWAALALDPVNYDELSTRIAERCGFKQEMARAVYKAVTRSMDVRGCAEAKGIAHLVAAIVGAQALGDRADDYLLCQLGKDVQLEDEEFQIAGQAATTEQVAQVVLVHDIFGNPFRPVSMLAEWRTDNARGLARQMYESRDFTAMPVLADALQDAGCADEQLLGHCRGPGPHVRGCWVVDLVLGKE